MLVHRQAVNESWDVKCSVKYHISIYSQVLQVFCASNSRTKCMYSLPVRGKCGDTTVLFYFVILIIFCY